MAQKLILMIKSRDEVRAVDGGCHVLSIAGEAVSCEVEWTVVEVVGSVTHPSLNRHM